MALLGNYALFLKCPVINAGGDSASGIAVLRSNWNTAGVSRSRFYGENWLQGTADRFGLPSGYAAPYSWVLPPKAGGIGSNVGVQGTGTFAGSGAMGVNLSVDMAGYGEISNLQMGLIISAILTIDGIGGLSATAQGALNAAMTMAGSGDMSGAIGALAGLVMDVTSTGTMSSNMTALGNMSMNIYVNSGTATVNELVDGVWNALAADFNASGTMGQKLNGAGSAGDPWTTDLTAYNTPGTAGKKLKDNLTQNNYIALK